MYLSRMILASNEWTSIRIPVIPKGLYIAGAPFGDIDDTITLKESIKILFCQRLSVGLVSRIDLVTSDPEVTGKPVQLSAYVHFEYWANNPRAADFRRQLENDNLIGENKFRLRGFQTAKGQFPFCFKKNGQEFPAYLPININNAPIPEYTGPLNIHQLWAKVCYYEEEEKKRAAAAEAAALAEQQEEEEEKREAVLEAAYEAANAYFDKIRGEEVAKGVYELEWPIDYMGGLR